MGKKLIFFDGDGTLWYPKATRRTKKPHWIYHDPRTKEAYLDYLELTPNAKPTLKILHGKGLYLVLISASPHPNEAAVLEMRGKLEHFGIIELFYSYHASDGNDPSGKAAVMLEVLKELELNKEDALMVGDSYYYDYKAATDIGIDALFIENDVSNVPETMPESLRGIPEIEVLAGSIDQRL